MSGPKVDHAEINRRIAAKLAQERAVNDRMLREALGTARDRIASCKGSCLSLGASRQEMMAEVAKLEDPIRDEIADLFKGALPSDPDEAHERNAVIKAKLDQVLAAFEGRTAQIEARISQLVEGERRAKAIGDFASTAARADEEDYACFDGELVKSLIAAEAERKVQIQSSTYENGESLLEKAEECIDRAKMLMVTGSSDRQERRKLIDIAKKVQAGLEKYRENGQVEGLVSAVNVADITMKDMEKQQRLRETAYVECMANAARIEDLTGVAVPLPQLHEFKDLDSLEEKCSELEARLKRAMDNAYIAEALEAVMVDHGYTVSRTVCLSEADVGTRKLFFAEEGGMGIHALVGPDGTIMLETAALDGGILELEDGALVEKHQATDGVDIERLVDQQRSFCDLHPALMQGLEDRGILVEKGIRNPVSEETAYMFRAPGSDDAVEFAGERSKSRRGSRGGEKLVEREMR